MRWLLLVGLNAFVAAGAAAQDIGVAEWVHPPAWGTPPGVAQRDAIVQFRAMTQDELVQTDPKGASNFQFDLGSELLVGPLCEVVLDETYFDPNIDAVVALGTSTRTVCVIRASAEGEALVIRTPSGTATITRSAATVAYTPATIVGEQEILWGDADGADVGSRLPSTTACMNAHQGCAAGPVVTRGREKIPLQVGIDRNGTC